MCILSRTGRQPALCRLPSPRTSHPPTTPMRTTHTHVLGKLLLVACSNEQLDTAGRSSQRAECLKQADAAARDRCLKDANTSYDTYKKEADAARK